MMQANAASLAEEYFAAANELVDAIKEKRIADYQVGNAALFLYRHSCELIRKAALPVSKRTHNLTDLTDRFVEMVKEKRHYTLNKGTFGNPLDVLDCAKKTREAARACNRSSALEDKPDYSRIGLVG
jgi:hypothetical protein